MIQISFRNIKTGTIRNLRQNSQLIHDPPCFQNPRIRLVYRNNPQSVRFLRPNDCRSENLLTPSFKIYDVNSRIRNSVLIHALVFIRIHFIYLIFIRLFFSRIAHAKVLTHPTVAMNCHQSNESYSMRVLSDVIMKVGATNKYTARCRRFCSIFSYHDFISGSCVKHFRASYPLRLHVAPDDN